MARRHPEDFDSAVSSTGESGRGGLRVRWRVRRQVDWSAYLNILPAFVILGVFHIFPVFYAVDISLQTGPVAKLRFVGLGNYARALTSSDFWTALVNTFSFAAMTIVSSMTLGLVFAFLLYQGVRGQRRRPSPTARRALRTH